VGSGIVIGMLTLTSLWFVSLPFDVAVRWWQKRHGLTRGSYVDWLTEPWLTLVGEAFVALLVIALVLALAGRFPRRWWVAAAPVLVAVGIGASMGYGGLVALDTHALRDPELRREARALERRLGAEGTPVEVEEVRDRTTQANAEAVGLGPTERVVLWDTLLDGRFPDDEVRVVLAHELGHMIRNHLWKGMAWFALFAVPGLYLIAALTDRRGGLRDPGVLPYALLVLVLLNLAAGPLVNVVSRRYEAEADWIALRTTRDPAAAQGLFERFSKTSLAQPNPPTWAYLLFDTHPTLMQRIAMSSAFATRVDLPEP
jgi:STE24 endopeptidase